jgi:hypothetical protein
MKIAMFHNFSFGGGYRAFWEYARNLSKDHVVDVYQIQSDIGLTTEDRALSNEVFEYAFKPLFGSFFSNPYIYTPVLLFDIFRMKKLAKLIARDIDSKGYDFVFIHNDKWIQNPLLLKYRQD